MGNKASRNKKKSHLHGSDAVVQAEWEKAKKAHDKHLDEVTDKMLLDVERKMHQQGMIGTSKEPGISKQEKHLREEEEMDMVPKEKLLKEAKEVSFSIKTIL